MYCSHERGMLNLNQSILDACVAKSKSEKRAVTDIRPCFVVENKGFKNMVKVLEPHYELLSRTHFSMKIVPDLYEQENTKIVDKLSKASSVALTKATESYVTVTAHYTTEEWDM